MKFGDVRLWHALDVLDYCRCKRAIDASSVLSFKNRHLEYCIVFCLLSNKIVELVDSRQPLQQLKMSSKTGGKDQGIILTKLLRG